jgi:hypothetical protein
METRDMSCLAEMEAIQAQVEELRCQLETLRIGEAHRGQSKDISLVAGIKEWTGESKGKSVYDFLTQVETLAKVSGWTNQDKALIVCYAPKAYVEKYVILGKNFRNMVRNGNVMYRNFH